MTEIGGALYVVLWIIALLRLQDFVHRHVFTTIFKGSYEAYFLWAELTMCFVIPLTMLSFKKVRTNPHLLYLAALSTILGFVTNRLNVAITSMDRWNGSHYLPSFTETSITLMICALGFFFFTMAVKFLPIFEDEHHETPHVPELAEDLQPTLVH
jgi:Ni/Fe-hydrogenase subunit HybB-like protein